MKELDISLMHPRDQIVEIISRIYKNGMTTTSGGNVSIIDENGDIWVTPSAIDKGSLRPEDINCVKADVFAQDFSAVIMENHGTVVGGTDMKDAYQRFETLEFCARTIINAKTIGKVKTLTDEQIEEFHP